MKQLSEFQRALLDATLAEFETVPSEKEIDMTPSAEFESQAETLFPNSNSGWGHYAGITFRRAIIIAAILALLAMIAMATQTQKRPLQSQHIVDANINIGILPDQKEPEQTETVPTLPEENYELQNGEYDRIRLELKLDVEARFSAPPYIEQFYFPRIPLNWTLMKYEQQSDAQAGPNRCTNFYYVWKPTVYPPGSAVIFMQDSLNAKGNYYRWGEDSLMYIFPRPLQDIPGEREITGEVVEFADIIAYMLTIGPISEEDRKSMGLQTYDWMYYHNEAINTAMPNGERRFYWTDGDNLFTLVVPLSMADEEIMKLIRSVREVNQLPEYK